MRKISQNIAEEKIRDLLKEAGLRCTKGRIDILRILLQSDEPVAHEDVFEQLRETGINRVTVYRVLVSLQKAGIVHRVDIGDRVWRFAVCGRLHQGHCHPHFICRECGRVECLMDFPMPELPQSIPQHTVEEQEVYLRGLCKKCTS